MSEELHDKLWLTIREINLSNRSVRCLLNSGLRYVGELVLKSEAEIFMIRNIGQKSLDDIRSTLSEIDLGLGTNLDDLDGWPSRSATQPRCHTTE
jgi:DNA-directed RNA polymerase subunit alpha